MKSPANKKPESLAAIARRWKEANKPDPHFFAEQFCGRVVALLADQDITASVEHPAYIAVELADGRTANFGTVNGPWGWDVDSDGETVESCPDAGTLPAQGSNPEAVAKWIASALALVDCVTDEERSNGRKRR